MNELTKQEPKTLEFAPYGEKDNIKLNIAIVQNLIAVKTKSGQTCSQRDALNFMMLCQAKRLNPFAGDAFLIGFDTKSGPKFQLITAHQAYLKRAELHPEFDGMKSGMVIRTANGDHDIEGEIMPEEGELIGGWATVYFKNRKQPTTRHIPLTRFQQKIDQQREYGGLWRDDQAGQITKCAEADALRSSFPTMLGGLYLREEIELPMGKDSHATDLPTAGLVEVVNRSAPQALPEPEEHNLDYGSDPEKEPEPTERKPEYQMKAVIRPAEQEPEPQTELEQLITSNGFTFADLIAWGNETGNIPGAESLPDINAVPDIICKRLLRAKAGLISGLNKRKANQ